MGAAVEPKVVVSHAVSAPLSVPKAAEAVPETVHRASAPGAAAPAPTSVRAGAAGELWRVVTPEHQNVVHA